MKRIALILGFVLCCNAAKAQIFGKEKIINSVDHIDQKLLTWGFYLGFNNYDFKFTYEPNFEDILVDKSVGFNVGLISDLRVNKFVNLRFEPGLIINQRDLIYDESYFRGTPNDNDLFREVNSTYIHFPLLLKVSTKRLNNFKPFIVGGFSAALNLSSNQDNPDDNNVGQFRTKTSMYFYELGLGVDFYLLWFKFTPSIRGIFAINDELIRDRNPNSPWTSNIDTMKTRGLFLNFTFQ